MPQFTLNVCLLLLLQLICQFQSASCGGAVDYWSESFDEGTQDFLTQELLNYPFRATLVTPLYSTVYVHCTVLVPFSLFLYLPTAEY